MSELTGLPDFNFPGQLGMVARSGTPRPTVERVSLALNRALQQAESNSQALVTSGIELTPMTPDQFAELIRKDIQKYNLAVKIAGVKGTL